MEVHRDCFCVSRLDFEGAIATAISPDQRLACCWDTVYMGCLDAQDVRRLAGPPLGNGAHRADLGDYSCGNRPVLPHVIIQHSTREYHFQLPLVEASWRKQASTTPLGFDWSFGKLPKTIWITHVWRVSFTATDNFSVGATS